MLLRSCQITDLDGPYDGQTLDLRIENGTITEMAAGLEARAGEPVHDLAGAHVSPGFIDLGAYLGDPGHEEREDIASLRAAALAGGYVAVGVLPNTEPVRQSVADVAYLLRQNGTAATDLLPMAALSKDLAGKDLTEMLDLDRAGALLFTDGPYRYTSTSLLKRGLEYARIRQCTIMVSPYDERLVSEGQMHEGEVSTRLGLPGIPVLSEILPLKVVVELLAYTGGKLIVHLLSSAEGVAEVRRAKALGLNLRATVSAHHLQFTDGALAGFDPNFKMLPPLRTESDRQALIEGLADGTIDCIVSNHVARHGEEKELEFPYADFGALGLQTAFRQSLLALEGRLSLAEIVAKFTAGPRLLLNDPTLHLRSGAQIGLTVFTPTAPAEEFTLADLVGKTTNSPLLGQHLPGRIEGVVHNGAFHPVT
ncbi:dihydroorotase [Neolewinella lacunae]|uniref:Dihydroorotase n=1 Tax=Neolewinella lacunae TaxID=1517758 RepID=A0A923PNP8_9BACT|nr:dihydroorotase [Neolewinella lacunae]MBC6993862.1 dihydroorotase [Neolewinella lacunae]MDN3637077.1 dihydroorotase [Neolewinella lacunae]